MVKYVQPSFEIMAITGDPTPQWAAGSSTMEPFNLIELAGRTCYKSEDLITSGSARKFVDMIVGRGHLSVIEHVSVTVRFISNRGFTHELVRHRLASYSQESTRYCNYSKDKHDNQITVIDQRKIILSYMLPLILLPPCNGMDECVAWLEEKVGRTDAGAWRNIEVQHAFKAVGDWISAMNDAERKYLSMLEYGASPQIARGVLPIDLKTEIVMTANLREWGHVLKLRTSPAAHPNMRQLMIPLLEEFRMLFPGLYDDLEVY